MSKWIAEFDLEDGDTMPEHMDLEYKGAKLDFHCRPKESIIDKIRAEVETEKLEDSPNFCIKAHNNAVDRVLKIIDKYKAETEG